MDNSEKPFNFTENDFNEHLVFTKDFKEVDSLDFSSKDCRKYLEDMKGALLDTIDADPFFWCKDKDSVSDFKTVSISCLLLAIAWRATFQIAYYPMEGEVYIYMKAKEIFFVPNLMYQLFLLTIHARDISVVPCPPEESECIVGFSFDEKAMNLIEVLGERIMEDMKRETDKELKKLEK